MKKKTYLHDISSIDLILTLIKYNLGCYDLKLAITRFASSLYGIFSQIPTFLFKKKMSYGHLNSSPLIIIFTDNFCIFLVPLICGKLSVTGEDYARVIGTYTVINEQASKAP